MHLAPELVLPLKDAGMGTERKHKIKAFREGWFWSERRWSQVTEDTGIGDPSESTADKGKAFFETITHKIAEVIIELDKCDVDDMYEQL